MFISFGGNSQTIITSTLIDSLGNKPIMFANIGIPNRGLGTVSDENGNFQLNIPDSLLKFPIKISCIGYNTKLLYANNFTSERIYLSPSTFSLNEIIVSEKQQPKRKTLGNTRGKSSIILAFNTKGLGSEMAIKIDIKHPSTKLKKLKFDISSGSFDSLLFRFNVYKVDSLGKPGENILKQIILVNAQSLGGKIEFDLNEYNIVVNEDIFIALEWIRKAGEMKNKTDYLSFNSQIYSGGTYLRKTSQDSWYKMDEMGIGAGLSIEVEY